MRSVIRLYQSARHHHGYSGLVHEAAHGLHSKLHREGSDLTSKWVTAHPLDRDVMSYREQITANGIIYDAALKDPREYLKDDRHVSKHERGDGLLAQSEFEREEYKGIVVYTPEPVRLRAVARSITRGIKNQVDCLPARLIEGVDEIWHHPDFPNNSMNGFVQDDDALNCTEDIAVHTEHFEKYLHTGHSFSRLIREHCMEGLESRARMLVEYGFLDENVMELFA